VDTRHFDGRFLALTDPWAPSQAAVDRYNANMAAYSLRFRVHVAKDVAEAALDAMPNAGQIRRLLRRLHGLGGYLRNELV
jgi:hypothetical protein